jgi:hypothetical protein
MTYSKHVSLGMLVGIVDSPLSEQSVKFPVHAIAVPQSHWSGQAPVPRLYVTDRSINVHNQYIIVV